MFLKAKLNKSDGHMYIDKYSVRANISSLTVVGYWNFIYLRF